MSRFDYVKYDEQAATLQADFKDRFEALEGTVALLVKPGGAGRTASLALTKLEEAYMWIGKAIRDDQIERNGSAELQEERKEG